MAAPCPPPGIAPPQPPGLSPVGAGAAADLHEGIARDIGEQVEAMICEAKRKNEATVSKEVAKIKLKMEAMTNKIKMVSERVMKLDPNGTGAGPLLRMDLQKSIAKLDEVWEGEVGLLKQELWQTIQAHNHNADLLKHDKTAIDLISSRVGESVPNPELGRIHSQLVQVDQMMQQEQPKEQQLDQFTLRLTAVQQQLSVANGGWLQAGHHAAATSQPKKATRNKGQGKAKAKPAAAQHAMSMRAEAPEFVPTW